MKSQDKEANELKLSKKRETEDDIETKVSVNPDKKSQPQQVTKSLRLEDKSMANTIPKKSSYSKFSTYLSLMDLNEGNYWYNENLLGDVTKGVKSRLISVGIVCSIFIIIEIIGGVFAGSLAIQSNAVYLFCDLLGFMLSQIAVHIGASRANQQHSFGFHRAEILGALSSVQLILVMSTALTYNAIIRIINLPYDLNANYMLFTALFGLVFNLIMVKILHKSGGSHHNYGHDHVHSEKCLDGDHRIPKLIPQTEIMKLSSNIDNNTSIIAKHQQNVKNLTAADKKDKQVSKIEAAENANIHAAFIHILGDIIRSVGVVIAAIIIKIWPSAIIADPICTFFFAIVVCFTTFNVIISCMKVLMVSTPETLDITKFDMELRKIKGVKNIHDMHVWSLTLDKPSMTAYIEGDNKNYILKKATLICRKYGIYHSTIQLVNSEQKEGGGLYFINCEHNIQ